MNSLNAPKRHFESNFADECIIGDNIDYRKSIDVLKAYLKETRIIPKSPDQFTQSMALSFNLGRKYQELKKKEESFISKIFKGIKWKK